MTEKLDMKTRFGTLILSSAMAGLLTGFVLGCNQSLNAAGAPTAGTTHGIEITDNLVSTQVKSALLAQAA
jgi:hypothetical protein